VTPAVADTTAARRLHLLAAMGITVYERRPATAAAPLALRFAPDHPDPWQGPQARLFRHLALALGLAPDAVRVERGSARTPADLAIAFGGGDAGSIAAPAPAALAADPAAKRALWRALRGRRGT
jgi:hypothetical protein